jgi:hypothetical protein
MIATPQQRHAMIMDVVNEVDRVYDQLPDEDRRALLQALKLFTDFPDVAHLQAKAGQLDEWICGLAKSGKENGKQLKADSQTLRAATVAIYHLVRTQHRHRFTRLSVRSAAREVYESPEWKARGFTDDYP